MNRFSENDLEPIPQDVAFLLHNGESFSKFNLPIDTLSYDECPIVPNPLLRKRLNLEKIMVASESEVPLKMKNRTTIIC